MSTPIPRGQLPPLPQGAEVTAWGVKLPDGVDALSPRMAMVIQLHVAWCRWSELAEMLERQIREQLAAALGGEVVAESGGLVGFKFILDPKNGKMLPASEEVRALAVLESEERDRVMKYAHQCHDVGLFGEDW